MEEVGKNYRVTDVTGMMYVGRLVEVLGPYCWRLEDAAWVAVTGRLSVFVADGRADGMEVEPVGEICVHWASWSPWRHDTFAEAI